MFAVRIAALVAILVTFAIFGALMSGAVAPTLPHLILAIASVVLACFAGWLESMASREHLTFSEHLERSRRERASRTIARGSNKHYRFHD